METPCNKVFGCVLGLLFLELCNGLPINLENSGPDSHTQFLTGLVAVLLTVCSVVLLAGCLCCQRRNGFKEFRNSPAVASVANSLDHGHINPIANSEFTIFTPISPPHQNNNVFLETQQIVNRSEDDYRYGDIDVTYWFDGSEADFPRRKLKYIRELGKGWFGRVVEGTAQGLTQNAEDWCPVVVRILEASATSRERVLFLYDATIYRCGSHPNVLKVLGRSLDTIPLLLLQEYCSEGDLKRYLKNNKLLCDKLMTSDFPLTWCYQLTSAMKFLHSHKITHPDLAARNCQLTKDLQLKLGDYGLSATLYPEDYYEGAPGVPLRWCAPETISYTSTTIQLKQISYEGNIWSLGITLWEICECGNQPYSWLTDDEVVAQVIETLKIKLPRPSYITIYTDYLYRLMQSCWLSFESRPTISQVDLMLADLMQVYERTKNIGQGESSVSIQGFDKRWDSLKPNTLAKTDNEILDIDSYSENDLRSLSALNLHISNADEILNDRKLSASMNNLHGSLDNLLEFKNNFDPMESWLENVASNTRDLSYVKGLSDAIKDLDNAIALENVSSDSSHQQSPIPDIVPKQNKLHFKLDTVFRPSFSEQAQHDSLQNSLLYNVQRTTSSESETEDELWKRKIERGVYSEKVRQKSRSVTDLMVLTHIDCSESDSETTVPSIDYKVNVRRVKNMESANWKFGSEGNLLNVQDKFQEELRRLQEERRDSLLFVPDNHSQTSSSLSNISKINCDLPKVGSTSVQSSPIKKLVEELNSPAEIVPPKQVYNVFNVSIKQNYNSFCPVQSPRHSVSESELKTVNKSNQNNIKNSYKNTSDACNIDDYFVIRNAENIDYIEDSTIRNTGDNKWKNVDWCDRDCKADRNISTLHSSSKCNADAEFNMKNCDISSVERVIPNEERNYSAINCNNTEQDCITVDRKNYAEINSIVDLKESDNVVNRSSHINCSTDETCNIRSAENEVSEMSNEVYGNLTEISDTDVKYNQMKQLIILNHQDTIKTLLSEEMLSLNRDKLPNKNYILSSEKHSLNNDIYKHTSSVNDNELENEKQLLNKENNNNLKHGHKTFSSNKHIINSFYSNSLDYEAKNQVPKLVDIIQNNIELLNYIITKDTTKSDKLNIATESLNLIKSNNADNLIKSDDTFIETCIDAFYSDETSSNKLRNFQSKDFNNSLSIEDNEHVLYSTTNSSSPVPECDQNVETPFSNADQNGEQKRVDTQEQKIFNYEENSLKQTNVCSTKLNTEINEQHHDFDRIKSRAAENELEEVDVDSEKLFLVDENVELVETSSEAKSISTIIEVQSDVDSTVKENKEQTNLKDVLQKDMIGKEICEMIKEEVVTSEQNHELDSNTVKEAVNDQISNRKRDEFSMPEVKLEDIKLTDGGSELFEEDYGLVESSHVDYDIALEATPINILDIQNELVKDQTNLISALQNMSKEIIKNINIEELDSRSSNDVAASNQMRHREEEEESVMKLEDMKLTEFGPEDINRIPSTGNSFDNVLEPESIDEIEIQNKVEHLNEDQINVKADSHVALQGLNEENHLVDTKDLDGPASDSDVTKFGVAQKESHCLKEREITQQISNFQEIEKAEERKLSSEFELERIVWEKDYRDATLNVITDDEEIGTLKKENALNFSGLESSGIQSLRERNEVKMLNDENQISIVDFTINEEKMGGSPLKTVSNEKENCISDIETNKSPNNENVTELIVYKTEEPDICENNDSKQNILPEQIDNFDITEGNHYRKYSELDHSILDTPILIEVENKEQKNTSIPKSENEQEINTTKETESMINGADVEETNTENYKIASSCNSAQAALVLQTEKPCEYLKAIFKNNRQDERSVKSENINISKEEQLKCENIEQVQAEEQSNVNNKYDGKILCEGSLVARSHNKVAVNRPQSYKDANNFEKTTNLIHENVDLEKLNSEINLNKTKGLDTSSEKIIDKLTEIIKAEKQKGLNKVDASDPLRETFTEEKAPTSSHLKSNTDSNKIISRDFLINEIQNYKDATQRDKPEVKFDLSHNQDEISPNSLTHFSVFTSTPGVKRSLEPTMILGSNDNYSIDLYSGLKTNVENPEFTSNFVQDETKAHAVQKFLGLKNVDHSDLKYSLETWDNFLGKTFDDQENTRNIDFGHFSEEPQSLLFIDSENYDVKGKNITKKSFDDLIGDGKCKTAKVPNESRTPKNELADKVCDSDVIRAKSNLLKSENYVTQDIIDVDDIALSVDENDQTQKVSENDGSWEAGGGWFLHPQSNSEELTGQIVPSQSSSSSDSYVGFSMDDEIMTAIRKELLSKLPHAQRASSEQVEDNEELDPSEKNEVFVQYNVYSTPLSPIPEETYLDSDDSRCVTPRRCDNSDDDSSDWSMQDNNSLNNETETQSPRLIESPIKEALNRHTPSQDSCCSNDTLFNLEELNATNDNEKNMHISGGDDNFVKNETNSETVEFREKSDKTCHSQKCSPLSTDVPTINHKEVFDAPENQEAANTNFNDVEADQVTNMSANCQKENKSMNTTFNVPKINVHDYIQEFLNNERYCQLNSSLEGEDNRSENDDGSSNTDVYLTVSDNTFTYGQNVAPLNSPEDKPWKELQASFRQCEDHEMIEDKDILEALDESYQSSEGGAEFDDIIEGDNKNENNCLKQQESGIIGDVSQAIDVGHEHVAAHIVDLNDSVCAKPIHAVKQNPFTEICDDDVSNEQIKSNIMLNNDGMFEKDISTQEHQCENYQSFESSGDTEYVSLEDMRNKVNLTSLEEENGNRGVTMSNELEVNDLPAPDTCDDMYGPLTDIRFSGPANVELMTTSFNESADLVDEQDWDSGSDTRSSSSGEFIWREGEHEASVKALRAAPQSESLDDIVPMEHIQEEEESSSCTSSSEGDEECPEFVPSAWDKYATPSKSALRSPEKSLTHTERGKKSKAVWFKKQKYHCVYEYPREPDSPLLQTFDLWKPSLDYTSLTDWDLDADSYLPALDEPDCSQDFDVKAEKIPRNLYHLTTFPDLNLGTTMLDEDFFISSSSRPFDMLGGLTSQFFPGKQFLDNWNENATPDSGVEDITPASLSDSSEYGKQMLPRVQTLRSLAAAAANRNDNRNIELGGLRHTRNKLKLDLPPSPSAFTSTRSFMVEPVEEILNRQVPTFTTFGKSRFLVQHVETPPDDKAMKNVSFEALPYKPTKQFYKNNLDKENQKIEVVKGEASLLDSADEDSGIESCTLERKNDVDV